MFAKSLESYIAHYIKQNPHATVDKIERVERVLKGAADRVGKPDKVFVYGTLKKGYPNHRLLVDSKAKFLGQGTLEWAAMVAWDWYPAIFREHYKLATVQGEIYEVDEVGLERLDRLENVPNLYERQDVWIDNYRHVWTYMQKRPTTETYRRVTDGIWRGPDATNCQVVRNPVSADLVPKRGFQAHAVVKDRFGVRAPLVPGHQIDCHCNLCEDAADALFEDREYNGPSVANRRAEGIVNLPAPWHPPVHPPISNMNLPALGYTPRGNNNGPPSARPPVVNAQEYLYGNAEGVEHLVSNPDGDPSVEAVEKPQEQMMSDDELAQAEIELARCL